MSRTGRHRKHRKHNSIIGNILIAVGMLLPISAVAFLIAWMFAGRTPLFLRPVVGDIPALELSRTEEVVVHGEPIPEPEPEPEPEIPEPEPEPPFPENGTILEDGAIALNPANEEEIIITFAGDILFDEGYSIMRNVRSRAASQNISLIDSAFDGDMLDAMRSADIFMVNNEFTYTDRGAPTPGKTYTFRAKPESAGLLLDMGADIVSLANNHSYDYGEVSLLDTLDTLDAIGMPYVGAGRNIEEAVSPVYFETKNVKIAFLSATQIERTGNPETRPATAEKPGVFRCLEVDKLLEAVRSAKEQADIVIVYIHWGTESTTEIDWAQKEQAPKLAQAGADVIIGDHPHVLQGIDWIGDTPVIYSMGNYLFNSKTQDTCLVQVVVDNITGALTGFRFVPALQSGCRTSMHHGEEKIRVLNYMQSLSPHSLIDEDGWVTGKE